MSIWIDLTKRLDLNLRLDVSYGTDIVIRAFPRVGHIELDRVLSVWGTSTFQTDLDYVLAAWGTCPTFNLTSISYGSYGTIHAPSVDWDNGIFIYHPTRVTQFDFLHFGCWHIQTQTNYNGIINLFFVEKP